MGASPDRFPVSSYCALFFAFNSWLGIHPPRRYVMSDLLPQRSALISQFEEHLARARYSSTASKRYLAVAGHFLKYIEPPVSD